MIKKQLIVASTRQDFYTTKRLLTTAGKLKYSASWVNPYEMHLPLVSEKSLGHLYFHRSTGTNYDDFDLLVTTAHEQLGYKISNPVQGLRNFRSKDQQMLFFSEFNLPAIPSIAYRGKTTEEIINLLEQWKEKKFIVKMVRGNQGIGVNLLESMPSLTGLLETFEAMKDQRFLIQPYISHTREWRLFICGGEILACIEKKNTKSDYRGNAKRASCKLLKKIPLPLSELALKGSHLSGLNYAGIDILEDAKGQLRFLEINPVPGFEQAEELSGIDIARELILKARSS